MSHVTVTVISDAICPWCYIGKRHLDLAIASLEGEVSVEVEWQPFELNPSMPREGMPRRDYRTAKFGSEQRSRELDAQVEEAARLTGIQIHHDRIDRTPNTFDAHRLIWLAGQHQVQDAVVDELFRRYFVEGEDIGEARVLADTARSAGLEGVDVPAFLEGDEGKAEVRQALEEAHRQGIQGVPTFIIEGQKSLTGAQPPEALRQAILEACRT
jgi:predicted DsbA family dithiol-disulfide isomerase